MNMSEICMNYFLKADATPALVCETEQWLTHY